MNTYILKYGLALFAIAILSLGCEKGKVDVPELNVWTDVETVQVGQPVRFNLEGNPDFIMFYSGELGNDYQYRDKDRVALSTTTMEFDTRYATGNTGKAKCQNPYYAVISYSTDFAGTTPYSQQDMDAATWIDISSRFTMPTNSNPIAGATIPSGITDISDIFPENDNPIYLRFHYHVEQFASGLQNYRTMIVIENLLIKGESSVGSQMKYSNQGNQIGWELIKSKAYLDGTIGQGGQPTVPTTNTALRFIAEANPAGIRDCWAISAPVHKATEVNLGMEPSVCIKSVSDPSRENYDYTYETSGEYTAVFVAASSSVYGRKEIVKRVKVIVVEN